MCDICSREKPKGLQFLNCYSHRCCRVCVDKFKLTKQPLLTRKSIGIRLECPVCTVAKHAKDDLPRRSHSWKNSHNNTATNSGRTGGTKTRNASRERAMAREPPVEAKDEELNDSSNSDDNADLGGGNEELEEILAPPAQPLLPKKLPNSSATSRNPALELQLPQYQRKSSAGRQAERGNLGRLLSSEVSVEVSSTQVKYELQDSGHDGDERQGTNDKNKEIRDMHDEEQQTDRSLVNSTEGIVEDEEVVLSECELTEDEGDVSLERKLPSFHLPLHSSTSMKAYCGSNDDMQWARHSYSDLDEQEDVLETENIADATLPDVPSENEETKLQKRHIEEMHEEELERGSSPCKATKGQYTYGWILSDGQRKCSHTFAAGDERMDIQSEEEDNESVGEIEGPEEYPSASGEWEHGLLEPQRHPGIDPDEPELPADCRMMMLEDTDNQEFWTV